MQRAYYKNKTKTNEYGQEMPRIQNNPRHCEEESLNSGNYKAARLQLKLRSQLSQTDQYYCKTRKETYNYKKGPKTKHTYTHTMG